MTREEAKKLLPIIQAFTEGKAVEYLNDEKGWIECSNPHFWEDPKHYRIKPESKYRSFKSRDECWNEMLKHQPFGWVINKATDDYITICSMTTNTIYSVTFTTNENERITAESLFEKYKFADGTPFGIKEEQ